MFGQTFELRDLATVALLVVLEGMLSVDNAMVLAILARRVEPAKRVKALSYGLIGALILRIGAVLLAAYLLRWMILKLLGGLYLIWVALEYFIEKGRHESKGNLQPSHSSLAGTIFAIEMTDLMFAIDSILAAVALIGPAPPNSGAIHPKLWVIVTGGMLGVVLMRFAAAIFLKLMNRFPRLNTSAFLLVLVIGIKLIVDWAFNGPGHPHRVDFQDPSRPPMWIFWGAMAACLAFGLYRPNRPEPQV